MESKQEVTNIIFAQETATVNKFHSLTEKFIKKTSEPDETGEVFEVVDKRFLRIGVDGHVWIKSGTAIAYRGEMHFIRERVIGADVKMLAREFTPLVKATGAGQLYCSDQGKRNLVLHLGGGALHIAGSALLAFEPALEHVAYMVGKVGLVAGGIFAVKLSGEGLVALAAKGDPLTLRITPDNPVFTDPDATIAWTDGVFPELKTELQWRMIFGHGGGEAVQMVFRGDGYVVVHSKEEDLEKRGFFKMMKVLFKKVTPF
jgi:uncharacterized protein (AIM24 family)